MNRFVGKVALVTGGATGIGYGIAARLIDEGATVALVDIDGAEAAAKELGATGYTADVSERAAVESVLQAAVEQFGALHVLVNNAGIGGPVSPIADYPLEDFDRVVGINLRGVFLGMRYGIPHILNSGGGSIVNISSAAGVKSVPGFGPYSASKAGVIAITKTASNEYSAKGVRVNVVLPGGIETALLRKSLDPHPATKAAVIAQHPIGRFGSTAELAATVAFLASDEAGYITGAVITADGGFTAT